MFKQAKENLNHLVLGAALSGIGVYLIGQKNYFTWPPIMAPVENDDTFGVFFILVGIAMIWWALDANKSARANHIILICASTLMAVLTFIQFFHWYLFGIPQPWISNIAITGVLMLLAERSDSK